VDPDFSLALVDIVYVNLFQTWAHSVSCPKQKKGRCRYPVHAHTSRGAPFNESRNWWRNSISSFLVLAAMCKDAGNVTWVKLGVDSWLSVSRSHLLRQSK
jgi:hypothetical protein